MCQTSICLPVSVTNDCISHVLSVCALARISSNDPKYYATSFSDLIISLFYTQSLSVQLSPSFLPARLRSSRTTPRSTYAVSVMERQWSSLWFREPKVLRLLKSLGPMAALCRAVSMHVRSLQCIPLHDDACWQCVPQYLVHELELTILLPWKQPFLILPWHEISFPSSLPLSSLLSLHYSCSCLLFSWSTSSVPARRTPWTSTSPPASRSGQSGRGEGTIWWWVGPKDISFVQRPDIH